MVFWISEDEAAPTMVISAPVTRPPTISTHSTREIIITQGLRRDFDLLRSGFIMYDTPILSWNRGSDLEELPNGQQTSEHAHQEADHRIANGHNFNDFHKRYYSNEIQAVHHRDLRLEQIV